MSQDTLAEDINTISVLRGLVQEKDCFIADLMEEIKSLQQSQDKIQIQEFHWLLNGDDVYEDDESEMAPGVYLGQPIWDVHDGAASLRGQFPISDVDSYVERKGNVAMVVHKYYTVRQDIETYTQSRAPLPDPEPFRQEVLLASTEMIDAVSNAFSRYAEFADKFPEIKWEKPLDAPFLWWYHSRHIYNDADMDARQAKLVRILTDWIDDNYGVIYEFVDDQLGRKRVSKMSIPYLVARGDVLIEGFNNDRVGRTGLIATTPFSHIELEPEEVGHDTKSWRRDKRLWTFKIKVRSYEFGPTGFYWKHEDMTVNLRTENEYDEVDITGLDLMPLVYASDGMRQVLERRGRTFWNCRQKQLVAYADPQKDLGNHTV